MIHFFEIVASYFCPKAYKGTSSLAEYGGNIRKNYSVTESLKMPGRCTSSAANVASLARQVKIKL